MTIRPYSPADRAACIGVYRSNVPTYFLADEEREWLSFVDEAEHPYFVLEAGGEILGCGGVGYGREPHVADLCWGMIRLERHGQGLGRRLTRHRLEVIAAQSDVHEIRLITSQRTDQFFGRFGFRITRTKPDGFGPGLDSVEMALVLDDEVRARLHAGS